jgi:hypothetical protein
MVMPTSKNNIGHATGRMADINYYDDEFPLLEGNGLYAAQTSGDGDCLFHSLSDQVCHPLFIYQFFAVLQSYLLCGLGLLLPWK